MLKKSLGILKFSLILSLSTCLFTWQAAANARDIKPLEIGVIPYTSPRALITVYEPMRNYLEQALGIPVKIYTAEGFKAFHLNSRKGYYDLVVTAAHLARLLQKDKNFTPLVRYTKGARGLIMATPNGPAQSISALRGKSLALPDKFSLASIVCLTYLRENGMQSGIDFKLLEVPSFASAILAVQKGDAVAAVSAPGALAQMPPDLRESVHIIADTGEYYNLVFLANPRLGKKLSQNLHNALLKFDNESDAGKQFFSATGFGGFIQATPNDMNTLDRYMPETRLLLKDKP